jgi:hypothetical protein
VIPLRANETEGPAPASPGGWSGVCSTRTMPGVMPSRAEDFHVYVLGRHTPALESLAHAVEERRRSAEIEVTSPRDSEFLVAGECAVCLPLALIAAMCACCKVDRIGTLLHWQRAIARGLRRGEIDQHLPLEAPLQVGETALADPAARLR